MKKRCSRFHRFGVLTVLIVLLPGCGGSKPSVSSAGPKSGGPPTSATFNHVSDFLQGFSQAAVCDSFTAYGPRLLTKRQTVFDNTLGLWYTISIGSARTGESLYQDQAKTLPAGSADYLVNDPALTLGGPFSVTAGAYSGLTGNYLQSLEANGSNGSISFSIPNVVTTDLQFEFIPDGKGGYPGNATMGVALQDGYLLTEAITTAGDGSMVTASTDSNSSSSSFSISSAFIGNGTISGKDPGLPAKVTWSAEGSGSVVFADGSTVTIASWKLSNPTSKR